MVAKMSMLLPAEEMNLHLAWFSLKWHAQHTIYSYLLLAGHNKSWKRTGVYQTGEDCKAVRFVSLRNGNVAQFPKMFLFVISDLRKWMYNAITQKYFSYL